MNLVKRPAVLTGFVMLALLSLLFLRTHNWRVPANITGLLIALAAAHPDPRGYGVWDAGCRARR